MSSSALDIPPEDLTQEHLTQWWALPTDRQRFVWALQTETRVRARKVQQRDITPTLQSNLLFELYLPAPDDLGTYDPEIPKRHVSLYLRKVNDAVFGNQTLGREPDEKFDETVYPLDLKPSITLDSSSEPILPPNMLIFEMLLEAYCGYSMHGHFHHVNPSMPRAAIMGGAIVAVLMSWRDPKVMKMEEWEELEQWFSNEKKRTTATKTETKTTKKKERGEDDEGVEADDDEGEEEDDDKGEEEDDDKGEEEDDDEEEEEEDDDEGDEEAKKNFKTQQDTNDDANGSMGAALTINVFDREEAEET